MKAHAKKAAAKKPAAKASRPAKKKKKKYLLFGERRSLPLSLSNRSLPAGLIFALFSTSAADAITVTNRDDKDHKLTVIEGEAQTDHILKAAAVIEEICMKGCVVRLNDSENDEYELEGTEVVSIEDGYLYYDGPVACDAKQR